jgi:hypothetical protein
MVTNDDFEGAGGPNYDDNGGFDDDEGRFKKVLNMT